jgi:hypothetical protein
VVADAVTIEPVCALEFPSIGKFNGNFRKKAGFWSFRSPFDEGGQWVTAIIPDAGKRELKTQKRELAAGLSMVSGKTRARAQNGVITFFAPTVRP